MKLVRNKGRRAPTRRIPIPERSNPFFETALGDEGEIEALKGPPAGDERWYGACTIDCMDRLRRALD